MLAAAHTKGGSVRRDHSPAANTGIGDLSDRWKNRL